ncbi:hypothetical protein BH11CYA1_BH11CYA1_19980 [soil metagenome]
MFVPLKNLVIVSILAAATVLASGPAESATKKRKSKAAVEAPSSAPYRGGMVARGGIPAWVQYDNGGMYYYTRNELEKAKQYWLASLKIAEQVVPPEAKKGLSITTEGQVCSLLNHLTMFVSDSKLNPKGSTYDGSNSSNLSAGGSFHSNAKRNAYDAMVAHLRLLKEDNQWFDRIITFAERSVGKDNRCLTSLKTTQAQMKISEINCKYTMTNLEKELAITRSNVDPKPIGNGLAPNGEYVPPGQGQTP